MGPRLREDDGFQANHARYVNPTNASYVTPANARCVTPTNARCVTPANAGVHSARQNTVQMACYQPTALAKMCSTLVTT